MPGGAGETLLALCERRGWDEVDLAAAIREAAAATGKPVARHDALVRMIRTWDDGTHEPSSRYRLLLRRVLPEWRPVNGTALHGPAPAEVLERARRVPGGTGPLEDAAARSGRPELAAMAETVRNLERQITGLREQLQRLLGEENDE